MIEKFNGIIYLIIFIVHFIGLAFMLSVNNWSEQKNFVDKFAIDHKQLS